MLAAIGRDSPAHAGIDLMMDIQDIQLPGFPRTRGDRPC